LSADALSPYLTLWSKIDFQGPVLRAMGIDPIPEPPFHGRPTFEVARDLARVVGGQIPAVPDGTFLAVTQAVIRWLDVPAKDILLLQQAYLDDYAADRSGLRNGPRHDISAKLRSSRKILKAFRFSTPPGAAGPWHEPIAYKKTRVEGNRQSLALNSVQQLRRLVLALRDACVMAVQAFVGMRISEVCGLQAYPLDPTTGLPACVEIRPSRSGLYDVFYVKGRLFKTTDDWQEVTWVAGLRWRGTPYMPPPIQALIVLERLFKPWRDLGGRTDLMVSLAHGWGLPKRATSIAAIPSDPLVEGQRDWIAQNVALPSSLAHWRVTSHQWRKSFAVYMIRTDSRMLPAVSQHFKHVSLAMTEQGYLGNDVELLGIMEDTATRETARMLCELATGKTIAGGKMAEMIRERAAEIETHLAGKSDDEQLAEMQRLVRSTDVRVWSCDWGWCFFRPETARCCSLQSGGRMKAVRPNEAIRDPSMCCECANLATTREHVPFWLSRRDKWQSILTEHQRNGLEGFALVARDRVKQCNSVLRLMGSDPASLGANHAA
jgi:integrase